MTAIRYGAIACVAVALVSFSGLAERCLTPQCLLEEWFQELPFEGSMSMRWLNLFTVGLPAGAIAPPIEGVDFSQLGTLLVVVNRSQGSPIYWPLVRIWSEIAGLQVIVVATDQTAGDVRELQNVVGSQVQLIADPAAIVYAALYRVGEMPSPVTFLIDREEKIVWRRRGAFRLFEANEHDMTIQHFALHGEVPEDALHQAVLWYGDQAPWPDFPLYTLAGGEYRLQPGRPLLILSSWFTGAGALIVQELEEVRIRFPEVRFIWLFSEISEQAHVVSWEYSRRLGLDEERPEAFGLSLEDYLADARERDPTQAVLEHFHTHPTEWMVLFDRDIRLNRLWHIYGLPTIMIIDADGRVVLPCVFYPINRITGEPVLHPEAKMEIARLLADALAEEQ